MRAKKTISVKTDDIESLETLMQESYLDACNLKSDAQKLLNMLNNGLKPENMEELTKLTREKTNILKMKEAATKLKLEVSKIQLDMVKNNRKGLDDDSETPSNTNKVNLDDLKFVRDELKKVKKSNE